MTKAAKIMNIKGMKDYNNDNTSYRQDSHNNKK